MNIIEECVNTALRSDTDPESNRSSLQKVEEQISAALVKRRRLTGFERHSLPALDSQIRTLERERERLKSVHKAGYLPCLNLEVLRMRTFSTNLLYPKIGLFSIDSPQIEFRVRTKFSFIRSRTNIESWSFKITPDLPDVLASYYQDVYQHLVIQCIKRGIEIGRGYYVRGVFLTAASSGIIPDSTRERMREMAPRFQKLFIAAETPVWEISYDERPKPEPRNFDPLVLGWDGSNLWIIDRFNLTPTEKYISQEFTS